MRKCQCGARIPRVANFCVSCGSPVDQRLGWLKLRRLVLASAVVILGAGWCSSVMDEPGRTSYRAATPRPNLEVQSWSWDSTQYGNRTITGRVRNRGNKTYSYIQINFQLYNKRAELVGSTMDNVAGLGPGETWVFKALVSEEDATHAQLGGVYTR